MYKGKIPVVRKWPKKIEPPYTTLQAEAMEAFSITCSLMARISIQVKEKWQLLSEGVRSQWTDTFKGIGMRYWKVYRDICPVVLSFNVVETALDFYVEWEVLQVYMDPLIEEEIKTYKTIVILKSELNIITYPIYFTLLNDDGVRLLAPYILLEL